MNKVQYAWEAIMQAIIETIFHPTYLISVTVMGMLMIKRAQGDKQFILFGIMAVSLAAGDSFHLVPRLIAVNTTGMDCKLWTKLINGHRNTFQMPTRVTTFTPR